MKDALILAHGAFHGPWCWHPTISSLEKQGIRCVAVDLNRGGLHADRDALQSSVDALRDEGCRVHAVGHSLGCASVASIDPETLASISFLAGPIDGPNMPDIAGSIDPDLLAKMIRQEDGQAFISRENAMAGFYHACPPELAEWALDRLRPTFIYGGESLDPAIWQVIPTTYIACTEDRAVTPDYQLATAALFPFSSQIDSDHSPMLGKPEELATIILAAMAHASE